MQETHWKDKFIEDYTHVWNGQRARAMIYYMYIKPVTLGENYLTIF